MGKLDDRIDSRCTRNDFTVAEGPVIPTSGSRAGSTHDRPPKNDEDIPRQREPGKALYVSRGKPG